jgi:hypothetical protein
MNIYNDVDQIQAAIDQIVENSEEWTPETETALSNLMQAKADTIANGAEWLCKIRANKTMYIDGIDAEIARLQAKKKRALGTIAWAEDYIHNLLKASGESKLNAGTWTIDTRMSTSVWVSPDFNNPEFMRTTTTSAPDKTLIKEALKSGRVIDGANLVEKENLSIK